MPRVIAPQQAPDLVACVGPGGQAAVFPGESDEQCGALGLAPLDVELSPDQLVAIEFEDSSAYSFANRTSSYQIGNCSSVFRDSSAVAYSGNTSAGASASSMLSGWNNRVSIVYIY